MRPQVRTEFVAPQTEAERVIAQIWCDVLGLDRVGVHDNFFELGGDSVLNLSVVSRVGAAGWRITPRQFFDHQTVAGLAAVAEPTATAPAPAGAVAPDAVRRVPLTPVQHWFFELDFAHRGYWNLGLSFA